MASRQTLILGGGMTGLGAGLASGLPIYEAASRPGGICGSYYVRPHSAERLARAPDDDEAYRFELGGGLWIFSGDPTVLGFTRSTVTLETHERRASVFFPAERLYVPYPLQNHLRFLDARTAAAALAEIAGGRPGPAPTLHEFLERHFGPTLCQRFFHPYHRLFTAGLEDRIAPQDRYKSPVSLDDVRRGATERAATASYKSSFVYPVEGLGVLAERMAARCQVVYGKRATQIDLEGREVHFADGTRVAYQKLISTLPLHQMLALGGLTIAAPADPHTAVLVVNIGAPRGPACPDDHWLYIPASQSGFHRVGVYSSVDHRFLPRSARANHDRVGIYVERSYPGGRRPDPRELDDICARIVAELRSWDFIGSPEVVDPNWIDVAYTWQWPGSTWRRDALTALEGHDVYQVGRYGRWHFQGIADSIRDGFFAGASFREY